MFADLKLEIVDVVARRGVLADLKLEIVDVVAWRGVFARLRLGTWGLRPGVLGFSP